MIVPLHVRYNASMTTLTVPLDEPMEARLREISTNEGIEPSEMAAKLLARAIQSARPRPVYDWEAIRANAAEFADEDLALAESDIEHRAQFLADEDNA